MRVKLTVSLATLLSLLAVAQPLAAHAASRPAGAARPALTVPDNQNALYSLDGWGGIHAFGSAPAMTSSAYWKGWDIARGLALFADGTGGYSVDGWGGLHAFGSAPAEAPPAYWQGWDIARGVVLLPGATAGSPGGYVLDGWGGLHPFGTAAAATLSAFWQGWDIARGVVLLPDGSGGYVLDGWGGLHPFAIGAAAMPATPAVTAYWQGWDIARGLALLPDGSGGYTLDGWGGLHAFGSAPTPGGFPYWRGWDIARSVVEWTGQAAGSGAGWVLDGWGGLHAFNGAPAEAAGGYWPGWDIAHGAAGPGSGSAYRLPPPPPPPLLHHTIIVSLTQQRLWAYNADGTLFLTTPVTTGMPGLRTDQGTFKIFAKFSPFEFISPWPPSSPYWYPDAWVTWAEEFVNDGTFLHDAPWEPDWAYGPGSENGPYASHGCVHVPNAAMSQLWTWAKTGDTVTVQP
ncbi:MAG TPA: L,D-transpeptidase [Candidatus Dormibacteraeota bacterium]